MRLARAWARLYTRGLPDEDAAARRAELDSDLWEHTHDGRLNGHPPAATALQIGRRLLVGAPADVAWHLERRRARRAASGGRALGALGMSLGTCALGCWFLASAVMVPLNDWWEAGTPAGYAALCAVAGLLVLAGMAGRRAANGWSHRFITAGVILGASLTWWAIISVVGALAVLGWTYTQRRESTASVP
jgi:hypothetical protein